MFKKTKISIIVCSAILILTACFNNTNSSDKKEVINNETSITKDTENTSDNNELTTTSNNLNSDITSTQVTSDSISDSESTKKTSTTKQETTTKSVTTSKTTQITSGAPKVTTTIKEPSTTPSISTGSSDKLTRVLELVNQERAKVGAGPLTINSKAQAAANIRASEIGSVFSHTRPDGTSCFTALDQQAVAYKTCGENIAGGRKTAELVMDDWMNSTGHRENILNPSFTQIGIGYADGGQYGTSWVQLFIG